jgi:hypothetical protein
MSIKEGVYGMRIAILALDNCQNRYERNLAKACGNVRDQGAKRGFDRVCRY